MVGSSDIIHGEECRHQVSEIQVRGEPFEIHPPRNPARDEEDNTVPFWGFRLNELKPEVGDIVCKDNPDFAPAVNFEVARQLDCYRSHCDIIMKIDSANQKILAIGGNVSQSVNIAAYDLAPGDLLAGTRHVFALLRNITDAE